MSTRPGRMTNLGLPRIHNPGTVGFLAQLFCPHLSAPSAPKQKNRCVFVSSIASRSNVPGPRHRMEQLGGTGSKALAEFMVAMAILKHSETNLKSSAQLCCQRPLCKCLQPTTAPRCLSLVPFLAPWYRSSGPKVLPACICTQRERSI